MALTDKDGNALTGADLIDKKEEAQKLADRIAGGEDIEEVKAEYNGHGQVRRLLRGHPALQREPDCRRHRHCQGQGRGIGMVTDDKYAYVYLVQDPLSGDTFENYRSTVLQNLKGDEFNETVAEWAAAVTLEENAASLRKHSPKHLKSLL